MPLWEDCDGKLIVDSTGKPAECETDPCGGDPGTKIITCGGNIDYIVPDVDAGSYEVVLSGFGGANSDLNGTYIVPAGASWGTGVATFPLAGGNELQITVNAFVPGCSRRVEVLAFCARPSSFWAGVYSQSDSGPATIDLTTLNTLGASSLGSTGACRAAWSGGFSIQFRAFA